MRDDLPPIPVGFLITGLAPGGAETQLVRLVCHLDKRYWAPFVVSMMTPMAFTGELEAAGVPLIPLGLSRGRPSVRGFLKMISLLRARKPRILVCFMYHAVLIGRLSGFLARVPVIISSLRTGNTGGQLRRWALRLTDRLGTLTTTNSSLVASMLVQQRVVMPNRVLVTPNAIGADVVPLEDGTRRSIRESLGLKAGDFSWLAVGRIEEPKDYPNLLEAFAIVAGECPQARLFIAGRGRLLPVMERHADRLGLTARVTFLGYRSDAGRLMAAMDAYVLSSAWEGMPNALMEAMALGTPVVATSVGGTPELIENGVTGYLVPPHNMSALAASMLRVMSLPADERAAIAAGGQAFVQRRFGLGQVVAGWESLFTELLSSSGSGNYARFLR